AAAGAPGGGYDLAAPPGGAGPWAHGPSAPMACQRLGLSQGCLLEGVALGHFGSAAGAALFQASLFGCSSAALWPMLAGSFTSLGGAVLRLCAQQAGLRAGLAQWPQRSALHIETYRMRSPASVTEPWAQSQVPGRACAGLAADAPAPALGGDGPGAQPTSQELHGNIADLRRRLQQKRSVGEVLTDRVEAALTESKRGGRRRKRRRRNSDSSPGASVFDGAPHVDSGRRIAHLARERPGALLSSGTEQIKRYLARRAGAGADSSLGELAASAAQCVTSAWHGHHPQSEMGVRKVREMRTVGECLDALLRGELDHLGDLLIQRLKALEQATKDGRWQVAQHLELCDDLGVGPAR
ncbi:unnamed protein product, partial [Prorocentrum cordatum]